MSFFVENTRVGIREAKMSLVYNYKEFMLPPETKLKEVLQNH